MKKTIAAILAGFSSLGFMACKTLDEENAQLAKVINFDAQAKSEIAKIINNVMPGANVQLADDVFSNDHRLFIQRASGTPNDNPIDGRITEMPRRFELYQSNAACFLLDSKTNKNYLLKKVECEPL